MLQPTLNRLVILPDVVPTTTASGIVLKLDLTVPPREGTVTACGPQARQVPAGSRVLFPAYSGTTVEHEGVKYLIMPEDDVIGVLEG